MPAKELILQKSAKKGLRRLPLNIHKRVIKSLEVIKNNPLVGKKLKGELKNYSKFRMGDYRIVYKFHHKKKIVEVVKIEHRQGVYK